MTNHGPMQWQFGDDEVTAALPGTGGSSAPALKARSRRRATRLILFLALLVASWTTGFYLGRVQRATVALEAEIQGRLDVESWARQQGDWDLFRTLLPPRTPSWQLRRLQTAFEARAPELREMKLERYVVAENGGRVDAVVQVTVAGQQFDIDRTYRLLDGRWRLINPDE